VADPQTANIQIYQPTRGSDVGTWDLPNNANFGAIDSLFGNVATISLSSGPVTLSTPPNSGAAWSGPYQSQSSLIVFTGVLTGDVQVTFPRAGFFIVQNLCTPTTHGVQLLSGGAGNAIGIPYGKKCHVFNDGTNMDFVNAPDPGTAYDLQGATYYPKWMLLCTVIPYLIKNGAVYNNSTYPALASVLGNAFGGTPGLTFAVPDELARARVGYDGVGTGRLSPSVCGINGSAMASAGGDDNPQLHNHTAVATSTDSGHQHDLGLTTSVSPYSAGIAPVIRGSGLNSATGYANITTSVTVRNAFSGASGNVQPTIVSFLPLVKT